MLVPIMGYIGEFGSGKTLLATYTGIRFLQENPTKRLYTNYPLKNLGELEDRWIQYKISELKDKDYILNKISNGLIIIDEIQEGADAYDFMRGDVRNVSFFFNQIRKLDMELIMTTPNLDFIASRLRKVCTHLVTFDEMKEEGVVNYTLFRKENGGAIKQPRYLMDVTIDLREYFKYYNSKYMIVEDKPPVKEVVPKKKETKITLESLQNEKLF